MKEIQTVGRRRLVVRAEDGRIKIDILLRERRLATLDLELSSAVELEQDLYEQRQIARTQ